MHCTKSGEKTFGNTTNTGNPSPNAKEKSKKGQVNIEKRTNISLQHGRNYEGKGRCRTGCKPGWRAMENNSPTNA